MFQKSISIQKNPYVGSFSTFKPKQSVSMYPCSNATLILFLTLVGNPFIDLFFPFNIETFFFMFFKFEDGVARKKKLFQLYCD